MTPKKPRKPRKDAGRTGGLNLPKKKSECWECKGEGFKDGKVCQTCKGSGEVTH